MKVWVLFNGNDDSYEGKEEMEDVFSSKTKAEKAATEIMNEFSTRKDSWWKKEVDEENEKLWRWCYKSQEKTRETDSYLRIEKYEVK
jgi:hypothetical protein